MSNQNDAANRRIIMGMLARYKQHRDEDGRPFHGKVKVGGCVFIDHPVINGVEHTVPSAALLIEDRTVMVCEILEDGSLHEIPERYWPPIDPEDAQRPIHVMPSHHS